MACPSGLGYPDRMTMQTLSFGCLVGLLAATAATASPSAAPSLTALAEDLEGRWEATAPSGKTIVVTYTLVSGGTTLMERFGEGPRASLTTYHSDGDDLLLTHYCPQGNQPRLRARTMKGDALAFVFEDVTNRKPEQSMLRELTYRFEREPTPPRKGGATGLRPLSTLVRTEIYVGPNGKDDVTTLRFVRRQASTKH